jgi:hypothetical protein
MTPREQNMADALSLGAAALVDALRDPLAEFKPTEDVEQWSRVLLNISQSIAAIRVDER